MYKKLVKPPQEVIELIVKSGSTDFEEAMASQMEYTRALVEPLRQGILVGDNVRNMNIFEMLNLGPSAVIEFPLDLLAPGDEGDFVAYTNPGNGRIPERSVEADYVQVTTFGIANSIDWLLRFANEARWDVVGRATQVFEAGFTKKINDSGWHTILSAAVDRNILVIDGDASAGQFTKRLVSLMKVAMIRNGGGNASSLRRGALTDLFFSPECMEDIRNWGLDQIDDQTRREYYMSRDGSIPNVFGVNLHAMDEFGEGQEYQLFFTNQLGASIHASDTELLVGLDLQANDSFLMPIRRELEVYPDPALHRYQRAGIYGWMEYGVLVADNRRCLLGSC